MTHPPLQGQNLGATVAPVYFPVSQRKLVVLSLASFGLYHIYWFYQNWKYEARRSARALWPLPRALFSTLIAYDLFKGMRTSLRQHSLPEFQAGLMAFAYFALTVTAVRLPNPYWLLGMLSFGPLLPVQACVNQLNAQIAPDAPRNDRYSKANITLIFLGALFWGFVLLGMLIPHTRAARVAA